jgi:hypothetical protein
MNAVLESEANAAETKLPPDASPKVIVFTLRLEVQLGVRVRM